MGMQYDVPTCPMCGATVPNGCDDFDGMYKSGGEVDFACHACGHQFRVRVGVHFEVVCCPCRVCGAARGDGA